MKILLQFFSFLAIASVATAKEPIIYGLDAQKSDYSQGEPVGLTLSIVNRSSESYLLILFPINGEKFSIMDLTGREIKPPKVKPPIGSAYDSFMLPMQKIDANTSQTLLIPLSPWFSTADLDAGEYTVTLNATPVPLPKEKIDNLENFQGGKFAGAKLIKEPFKVSTRVKILPPDEEKLKAAIEEIGELALLEPSRLFPTPSQLKGWLGSEFTEEDAEDLERIFGKVYWKREFARKQLTGISSPLALDYQMRYIQSLRAPSDASWLLFENMAETGSREAARFFADLARGSLDQETKPPLKLLRAIYLMRQSGDEEILEITRDVVAEAESRHNVSAESLFQINF